MTSHNLRQSSLALTIQFLSTLPILNPEIHLLEGQGMQPENDVESDMNTKVAQYTRLAIVIHRIKSSEVTDLFRCRSRTKSSWIYCSKDVKAIHRECRQTLPQRLHHLLGSCLSEQHESYAGMLPIPRHSVSRYFPLISTNSRYHYHSEGEVGPRSRSG